MNTRKSMKLPIIITFFVICLIVYLFTNIKQTIVSCHKTRTFETNAQITESLEASIENKKISSLDIIKKITIPEKYLKKEQTLYEIKESIEKTIEYLGKSATVEIRDNNIVVHIKVNNQELVLLDNIILVDNNGVLTIDIDVNTKSNHVVSLKIGDNYTDGELMQRLKNEGYSCQ